LRSFLAALFILAFIGSAQAWIHGAPGGSPSACPNPVPVGQDDGCAGANQNALFINTGFFTNARQSGQPAYVATPSWNIAGVTYPVGQITPDVGLIDFATSPPAGWSNVGNSTYRNDNPVTVSGYWINDVGLFKAGGNLTLTNNHITMGKNTCLQFSGTAQINIQSSSASLDAENNTWDTDSTCSWSAELYGTAYDPGLAQQFSANITIASNTLTINSGGTGYLSIHQFLNWSGIGQQVRISTNVSPGGITSCSGAACNGTTWTVCQLVIAANSGACNATVTNVGPIAGTTGPIQPVANAAVRLAGSNTTASYVVKYNAILKYSTMAASATGGLNDHRFNYFEMTSKTSDHDNFVANLVAATTTYNPQYYQKFNTIVWDANTPSTGTTILGTFLTENSTSSPSGGQVTWNPWDISYNTVVANSTSYPTSGSVTAAMFRMLQQANVFPATVANSGTSISSNIWTTGTVTGTITTGDYIWCDACSAPIQIGTQIDATHWNVTSSINIASSNNWRTVRYPGKVTTLLGTNNYFDKTGAGTAFINDANTPIGTSDFSGNINMRSGSACTPSSCP